MKSGMAIAAVLVAAACVGGCTTTERTPATAPDTTAPPSTTTTQPLPSSTIAVGSSTTIDRLAEVTAIVEVLEARRLEAIYSADIDAFTALFADTAYLDQSLAIFDQPPAGDPPQVRIQVLEVLKDEPDCLAVYSAAAVGDPPRASDPATTVLVKVESDWVYAFAYRGKEGWLCDGEHPLGS